MATAEADRLTAQFRQQVLRLAELIARRIGATARRADASDIDRWWDQVSPRVQREILTGQSALAALARRYYMAHAALEGVALEPVVVDPVAEQIAESLRVTGPVAFKTHMAETGSDVASLRTMATTLEGSATRLVLEGPRQTAMQTFRQRPAVEGWRRVTAASACAFCIMLRGRGAVYSRQSVTFRAHDHCRCSAELVYRREAEPPDVQQLQQQWREATAGLSGDDALAAWRRFVAAQ